MVSLMMGLLLEKGNDRGHADFGGRAAQQGHALGAISPAPKGPRRVEPSPLGEPSGFALRSTGCGCSEIHGHDFVIENGRHDQ